jgi:hypothetical protein
MGSISVDFRVEKNENRGVFYSETDRCLIYLPMHETIYDVYKTITHEMLHAIFDNSAEIPTMDEDQEEKLIFFTQWAEIGL